MTSKRQLDQLLVTMDVAVHNFALCEVRSGRRLVGAAVDAIMIHYVLSGTMHMTVPGFPPIVCGPGCIALIPPGLTPSMTADELPAVEVVGTENCSITTDGLLVMDAAGGEAGDLRLVAGVILASCSGSFGILDNLKKPIAEDLSDIDIVRHAYATMLQEISSPHLGSRAVMSALMKACLVVMIRRACDRPEPQGALLGSVTDPRLSRAVGAVLDNPAHPHTLASLADAAGMSRSRFTRHFGSAYGMSPMEFVAKTRLYHAAEMLRSTPIPIKVIAGSIGFQSRSHFSRAFRAAFGVDPSNFRKSAQHGPIDPPAPLYGSRERFALAPEPG